MTGPYKVANHHQIAGDLMESKSRVEGLEWAGRLVLRLTGGPVSGGFTSCRQECQSGGMLVLDQDVVGAYWVLSAA